VTSLTTGREPEKQTFGNARPQHCHAWNFWFVILGLLESRRLIVETDAARLEGVPFQTKITNGTAKPAPLVAKSKTG
jgi:hypothetical protein